jgi:hypothetical protein
MHEYESSLPYGFLVPTHDYNPKDIVECPLYSTTDRTSSNPNESSFICYIPLKSDMPEHLILKKGIMIAIDDRR